MTTSKANGLAGTILFHSILLLMLLFYKFVTPLPLPEEQGILVNFGTDDFGRGDVPVLSEKPADVPVNQPAPAETESGREQVLTQDFEEAPVIAPKPKKEKKKPDDKKPVETTKPAVVAEKPAEKPREVNKRLLYRGAPSDKNSGTSQGQTTGNGDQGSPFGSVNSDNYSKGGGTGNSGISFDLAGRRQLALPKPDYNQQEQGKVVVEVTVDQEGRVTSAIPGVKGSNTLNAYLLEMAKKAALAARFDRKPDAPAIQKGTITYQFVLQ